MNSQIPPFLPIFFQYITFYYWVKSLLNQSQIPRSLRFRINCSIKNIKSWVVKLLNHYCDLVILQFFLYFRLYFRSSLAIVFLKHFICYCWNIDDTIPQMNFLWVYSSIDNSFTRFWSSMFVVVRLQVG